MTEVGAGRRVAIVGAGPSGFYTAEQLLAQGFEVDLLDLLPTPFGLVRAGVAPDHPKIKSVTRVYEKTAARDGFRFFGGVAVGDDVTRADLLARYHAVVYAVGTASDNRLGIPGEDRPGSYAATRFVAWYNGHPDARDEHVRPLRHARGRRRQRQRRDRHRAHARARPRRAGADRHRRPRARGARRPRRSRRSSCSAAAARRRPRSPTPSCASWASCRALRRSSSPSELELDEHSRTWLETEADADGASATTTLLREYSERPLGDASHRITCASCAPRSSCSARARTAT